MARLSSEDKVIKGIKDDLKEAWQTVLLHNQSEDVVLHTRNWCEQTYRLLVQASNEATHWRDTAKCTWVKHEVADLLQVIANILPQFTTD